MSKYTIVRVSEETREKLRALGKKSETYDEIIRKLLKKEGPSHE